MAHWPHTRKWAVTMSSTDCMRNDPLPIGPGNHLQKTPKSTFTRGQSFAEKMLKL